MKKGQNQKKGRGRERTSKMENASNVENWIPKTLIGKKVKNGEITHIDQILDSGIRIMEPEIVDVLVPNLNAEMLMIGQAKGKFGGGQRRTFRQTQKKTAEGNKPSFGTYVIIGNNDGYVGLGTGKSKETVPAREKALRNAKLNIIKVPRGSGSWQDYGKSANSIPFKTIAKCGSVKIALLPAPKGTGLSVASECRKIIAFAGIKDVWSQTTGQTRTTVNLVKACFEALKKLSSVKVKEKHIEELGIVFGAK